jgi:hypothetical protein
VADLEQKAAVVAARIVIWKCENIGTVGAEALAVRTDVGRQKQDELPPLECMKRCRDERKNWWR